MTNWTGADLVRFYQTLFEAYGPQHWWPSDSAFETIIGAILAQNVSWNGAHTAVCALKDTGLMNAQVLYDAGPEIVAPKIRSSRYYNQKSKKIMTFLDFFLKKYAGSISQLAALPEQQLRKELLSLTGFGPETVDSILLYALDKPVFVVDAYTRRIGSRQGWFDEKSLYEKMQEFFMSRLIPDVPLYNDFHAQIVFLGNQVCKKTPLCLTCPVREIPGYSYCKYAKKL